MMDVREEERPHFILHKNAPYEMEGEIGLCLDLFFFLIHYCIHWFIQGTKLKLYLKLNLYLRDACHELKVDSVFEV